jgi:hypothetical protein
MATETAALDEQFRPTALAVGVLVVGHLGLLVAVPSGPTLPTLVAIEAGALVVLAGAELLAGMTAVVALRLGVVYTALTAATWAVTGATDSLAVAVLLLAAGVGFVAYALHRYELVSLGLVEDGDEQ